MLLKLLPTFAVCNSREVTPELARTELRRSRREVTTKMANRIARLEKKMLPCLKCGKLLLTDKYHRFCKRCRNANLREGIGLEPVRVASGGDLADALRDSEW